MTRKFFKLIILIIVLVFIAVLHLSLIGVETKRFNNQISAQINQIDDEMSKCEHKLSI